MALILWIRKNNTLANKIIGLIIFIPVVAFTSNLLIYLEIIYPVFILIYLNVAVGLLFGPALLYYFNLMIGKKIKLKWKHLLHLIPSFVAVVVSLPLLFLNQEEKTELLTLVKAGTDDTTNILGLALLLHILSYLFLSWNMQKKHYADVKSFFTGIGHIRYHWIRKFILWLMILNVLFIVAYLIPVIFSPGLMMYADLVATPLLTFLIYLFILITGFSNQAIFTGTQYEVYTKELLPFNEYVEEADSRKKYVTSSLKESQIDELHLELLTHITESKLYFSPDLTIKKLADNLGFQQHHLSQVINQKVNMNFFDFINSYRVEEAKEKLQHIQQCNLTIEGIGTECGFGSPSAFYRAFKKSTGLTPSQYIKQL